MRILFLETMLGGHGDPSESRGTSLCTPAEKAAPGSHTSAMLLPQCQMVVVEVTWPSSILCGASSTCPGDLPLSFPLPIILVTILGQGPVAGRLLYPLLDFRIDIQ